MLKQELRGPLQWWKLCAQLQGVQADMDAPQGTRHCSAGQQQQRPPQGEQLAALQRQVHNPWQASTVLSGSASMSPRQTYTGPQHYEELCLSG